jgi:alanine dehydrogenase
MTTSPLLYLSAEAVASALPMADALAAARETFLAVSARRVEMPARTHLVPNENATVLLMASLSASVGRLATKLLTLYLDNRDRGLPFIQGLITLADAETGTPLAIMDARAVTALRTGAASGAATEALACPGASVAAIFGAGHQARTQLEAVSLVRPIARAWVYDIHREAAEIFAVEMAGRLNLDVRPARHPAQALSDAGIVCLATTSGSPVFDDADVRPGTHINAIGVYKPHLAEVPPETVCRAAVFVDQVEAALAEAGDLLGPLRAGWIDRGHIRAELGQVLAGSAPGRRSDAEVTLYKSVGLAAQDLFAAARAYENARRRGLGLELPR